MDLFGLPLDTSAVYLLISQAIGLFVMYAPKVILALLTLIIGFYLTGLASRVVNKALSNRRIDRSLSTFLESVVRIGLKILVLVSVISMLGVQVSSLVAIIGATGLAVGLSLQGALSNFAGGVMILFFKPFKVGDLVSSDGHLGIVEKITVVSTVIRQMDNKLIVVPNGKIANERIENYSDAPNLRVSMEVGIGYNDDIKLAKETLLSTVKASGRVEKTREPIVGVKDLGDSAVILEIRFWVQQKDYFIVKLELYEAIKLAFDAAKISIPFPTQTLYLQK